MKKYVYLTKELGVLIPHFVESENKEKVKNDYGVCIDNVYDYILLFRVRSWYYRVYGRKIILSEMYGIYFIDFKNKEYITTFSQFREIVNDYRNRE